MCGFLYSRTVTWLRGDGLLGGVWKDVEFVEVIEVIVEEVKVVGVVVVEDGVLPPALRTVEVGEVFVLDFRLDDEVFCKCFFLFFQYHKHV